MENKNIELIDFINKLFGEKKEFEGLEPEVVEQIKSDLMNSIENRINAVIVNNLDEKKLEEFNEMLDSNKSDEDVQAFCNENIPDLAQLIASELALFRQTYLG